MSVSTHRWLPLLALPFVSCVFVVSDGDWSGPFGGHSIRGSGVRAAEDRSIPAFHAIELRTCADVVVEVGGSPALHLTGDDNLLRQVKTEVEDGVLVIDLSDSCNFRCGLELAIHAPTLERFNIAGSGDVRIENLANERVQLSIEGSGTIQAHGATGTLTASIEGSGDLELAELASDDAHLSIEGSGSMEVQVAKTLHYSIEGSGSIRYAGAAQLHGEIEGSGEIEKSH